MRAPRRRQLLKDLATVVGAVTLQIESGIDLATSWHQAEVLLDGKISSHSKTSIFSRKNLGEHLAQLSVEFPVDEAKCWFGIMAELYEAGTSLAEPLKAFSRRLRQTLEQEMEEFSRRLPSRINILLLFFFLPPALLLVSGPLVFLLFATL